MKKLIFAAMAASAMLVVAEGAKKCEGGACPAPAKEAAKVEATAERPRPPRFDRAKFEEMLAKRKAERTAKVVDAIKAAGLDEAKAKELAETIEKIYSARPERPMRPPRPPRKSVDAAAPAAAPAAPAAAPAAK